MPRALLHNRVVRSPPTVVGQELAIGSGHEEAQRSHDLGNPVWIYPVFSGQLIDDARDFQLVIVGRFHVKEQPSDLAV